MILISKEKFMFEQFLNGIFIIPLLGIFIMRAPDCLSSSYFKHTICGTSPLLIIGTISGSSSSICSYKTPLISVETYSSGILALTKIVVGSPSLIGSSSS
jgi:hypothetical protein